LTPAQAEAALRLWAEYVQVRAAGDNAHQGHFRRASIAAGTGSGRAPRSQLPASSDRLEAEAWAARVEAVIQDLAKPLRLVLVLYYRQGLPTEAARTDMRLKCSAEEFRRLRRDAVALVGVRLGDGG
jgi:hypothetical protein